MKRRSSTTGLYETSWYPITKYIQKFGNFEIAIDDSRLNRFTHSGVTLLARNDWGEFNSEVEGGSLFYQYLTRYRTIIKIEAGYTDGAGNQFPTDPAQGVFILDGEINITPKTNVVELNCKSIIAPFDEFRAVELNLNTNSITASEVLSLIRDVTDGAGTLLFRQFISASSWDIQTTTNLYRTLGTTTSLNDMTVWELMNALAEAEGYVLYATRFGGLVFKDREPWTAASQFSFYGMNSPRPNVISVQDYKEAVDKIYTHIMLKYIDEDTTTSYIQDGTITVVGPTSDSWKYGRKTYEFENFWMNTATAQNVSANLLTQYGNLKNEIIVDSVFIPHLDLMSMVDLSYSEESIGTTHLWDLENWAADTITSDVAPVLVWAGDTGASIDFAQEPFYIISKQTDLDTFKTTFKFREA
jgi:hypothetical protein